MPKYIDCEQAVKKLRSEIITKFPLPYTLGIIAASEEIKNLDDADVVSRDCYEQILAENETMKKMLARVGKRPGDSMEDLKWVKYELVKDDDPYKPLWPNWED